jgi:hypothetical protein
MARDLTPAPARQQLARLIDPRAMQKYAPPTGSSPFAAPGMTELNWTTHLSGPEANAFQQWAGQQPSGPPSMPDLDPRGFWQGAAQGAPGPNSFSRYLGDLLTMQTPYNRPRAF